MKRCESGQREGGGGTCCTESKRRRSVIGQRWGCELSVRQAWTMEIGRWLGGLRYRLGSGLTPPNELLVSHHCGRLAGGGHRSVARYGLCRDNSAHEGCEGRRLGGKGILEAVMYGYHFLLPFFFFFFLWRRPFSYSS